MRTFYRILAEHKLVRDRRNQRRHPRYERPVLQAHAPNEVWTWDITVLPGVRRREVYQLTVILDVFSRYVTGWMVGEHATSHTAQHLILTTIDRYGVDPASLKLHSDRGTQMRAGSWQDLEEALGLNRSFSRPRVSNDNPFSEAQFRTLKYRPPGLPRFTSLADARGFCQDFFRWYNHDHFHSGIADMTPATVHFARHEQVVAARQAALDAAYLRHPQRFARPPMAKTIPAVVGINHVQEVTFADSQLN